jgi:hypothetical protein
VDVVRGKHPPFDPLATTQELAALAKDYGLTEITGDAYSAAWVETAWRDVGLKYVRSERSKNTIYLECLPLFTRGAVSIPDHKRLIRELRLLERHAHRSGKDTVDHGRAGSDDYANAVCGALALLADKPKFDASYEWAGPPLTTSEQMAMWRRARLHAYCLSRGTFVPW